MRVEQPGKEMLIPFFRAPCHNPIIIYPRTLSGLRVWDPQEYYSPKMYAWAQEGFRVDGVSGLGCRV